MKTSRSTPKAFCGLNEFLGRICFSSKCGMLGKLRVNEARDHRPIHLLRDGWIGTKLPGQSYNLVYHLFDALWRANIIRGFLEFGGLLDVVTTLCQVGDDLTINAVNIEPNLVK